MKKWILLAFFILIISIIPLHGGALQDAQLLSVQHSGEVYQVSGESMLKFFNPNSLIVTIPAEFENIRAGQLIVYKNTNDKLVVHRAIQKINDEWIVCGSENKFNDKSTVKSNNLIGIVYAVFNCWNKNEKKLPIKEVFALTTIE